MGGDSIPANVVGELRNVHEAVNKCKDDLWKKIDEGEKHTAQKFEEVAREVTQIQTTVELLPMPPARPCGELLGHLKNHRGISAWRWGIVASVIGGTLLLIVAKLVDLI
jgi:hypothetical protein